MTGPWQGTPTDSTSARRAGFDTQPARRRSRSILLLLGLCAVAVLATLTGGCSGETPSAPSPARKAAGPSAADLQRLKEAKAAAAAVLADVEACEKVVMVKQPSLSALSAASAHANASVQAFARTENAKLIPAVTTAIALAAKDYADCCAVWSADNKAAPILWRKGFMAGKTASEDSYRHPDRYERLWVKGGVDLGAARQALRDATL
jgi:hypothetical protein